MYNQGKQARALYKRAAAAVSDNLEFVLCAWEEFERNFGTLETWSEFSRKSRRFRELALEKEEKERQAMEKANLESREEGENEGEGEAERAAKRQSPMEREELPEKRENVETITQKKKMLREKKQDADVQQRTVFVNNLSFAAAEADVQERFQQYGEIVEVTIVRNNHGKSRGFGYVEFATEEAAESALVENGKVLKNRKMEVKKSVPQNERKTEKQESQNTAPVLNTIFVSGLPSGVSEYEFSVFFSKVGREGED